MQLKSTRDALDKCRKKMVYNDSEEENSFELEKNHLFLSQLRLSSPIHFSIFLSMEFTSHISHWRRPGSKGRRGEESEKKKWKYSIENLWTQISSEKLISIIQRNRTRTKRIEPHQNEQDFDPFRYTTCACHGRHDVRRKHRQNTQLDKDY